MASDSSQEDRIRRLYDVSEPNTCSNVSPLCIERNSLASKVSVYPPLVMHRNNMERGTTQASKKCNEGDSLQNDLLTRSQYVNDIATNHLMYKNNCVLIPVASDPVLLPEQAFLNTVCQVETPAEFVHKERKRWTRPYFKTQGSQCDSHSVPVHETSQSTKLFYKDSILRLSNTESELCTDKDVSVQNLETSDFNVNKNVSECDNSKDKTVDALQSTCNISCEERMGILTGRAPSPASGSSVASIRPLEWDSGADVGYMQLHASGPQGTKLSTLERMALSQRHITAALREKENMSSELMKQVESMSVLNTKRLRSPVAESTRDDIKDSSSLSNTASEEEISPILRPRCTDVLSQMMITERCNENVAQGSKVSCYKDRHLEKAHSNGSSVQNKFEIRGNQNKGPNKFQNTNENAQGKTHLHKVSKSDPYSASSSSTTTVVQKKIANHPQNPKYSKKHLKKSVYTQCDESQGHEATNFKDEDQQKDSLPYETNENVVRQPRALSVMSRLNSSSTGHVDDPVKEICNTLDSVTSSTQTNESFLASHVGGTSDGHKSTGVIGSAHSFEYLPGHVYEQRCVAEKTSHTTDDSSTEYPALFITARSKSDSEMLNSPCSSFSRDLKDTIKALSTLVAAKQRESGNQAIVMKKVVKMLVNNTYSSDHFLPQQNVAANNSPDNTGGNSGVNQNHVINKDEASASSGISSPLFVPRNSGGRQSSSAVADIESSSSSTSINLQIRQTGDSYMTHLNHPSRKAVFHSEHNFQHRISSVAMANVRESALLSFYEREKVTQLSWIDAEINHLCNLKQFLERQFPPAGEQPLLLERSDVAVNVPKHSIKSSGSVSSQNELRELSNQFIKMKVKDKYNDPKSDERGKPHSPDISHGEQVPADGKTDCNMELRSEPSLSSISQTHDWNSHKVTKFKSLSKEKHDIEVQVSQCEQYSVAVQNEETQYLDKEVQTSLRKEAADLYGVRESQRQKFDKISKVDSCNRSSGPAAPTAVSNQSDTLEGVSEGILDSARNIPAKNMTEKTSKNSSKSAPMCCCECRKVLRELITKSKNVENRNNEKETEDASVSCKHCKKQSHNELDTGKKNAACSYSAIPNSAESSHNVARKTIATETVGSVGVQTTSSVGSLPAIHPKWFMKLEESKRRRESGRNENHPKRCPCCNGIENMSINSLENTDKSITDEKRSQSNVRVSESISAGYDRKVRHSKYKNVSGEKQQSSTHPLGYILTLEESDSLIPAQDTEVQRKPLEEVKMKVPPSKRKHEINRGSSKSSSSSTSSSSSRSGSLKENVEGIPCHRKFTLQEYLLMNRPDFVASAEHRRLCIDELMYLRELKRQTRQRLLAAASSANSFLSREERTNTAPPSPRKRVFTQRTMRKMTEKKYRNLPEVKMQKAEKKRKEDFRTNRLMAEIFTRKLQKKTLKGEVNLSNSVSVISSM